MVRIYSQYLDFDDNWFSGEGVSIEVSFFKNRDNLNSVVYKVEDAEGRLIKRGIHNMSPGVKLVLEVE